ncbi:hypothetical protein K431DRAFT_286182 [Polychaeton citri CBS 116435]|uniref:Uncharacterized protein n=1 Tax=Polychaeton citri CBS 116435 TaxID=1314669 RepID=A0A9P4UNQ1_9PEZI|nr:hypothetical protein K431DRAFT_286182 [Polychaeton citri CBS 116435]
MSAGESIQTHGKTDTGLSNSTHSSSSSAIRYGLDEEDKRPVLTYQYRGPLKTSSQKDLCAWLDKDEKLRVTRKHIPRYTSYLDVKRHDLYLADEKEAYRQTPNYNSSLASVKMPMLAYWSRILFGSYDDLYIVSPESSPNSSVIGDDNESRHTSPTSAWGMDSELDAKLGALREQREREEEESRHALP